MALRVKGWEPDTCGCVLEFARDDADGPVLYRPEYFYRFTRVCQDHADLTPAQRHVKIFHENRDVKNKFIKNLLALVPEVYTVDEEGRIILDATHDIYWAFDSARVFQVTLIGFTTGQRNRLRTWVTNNLPGEVVVNSAA